jgi:transcriptional regulator with XRE-family HTH domain
MPLIAGKPVPRPLRRIDPDAGPVQRFAQDLRELRAAAGRPTYRELAERTRFSLSAISDAARGDRLPSLDVTLAFVDACDGDRDAWALRWSEVSAELARAAGREQVDAQPPYRGLAPYEAENADVFFGREQLLDELVARLQNSRFLAVLGPSGIGKSSLLRAGLLPAARAGRLPGAAAATLVTPGEHPLERLGTEGVTTDGLLVVDQFEEVFTTCRSPGERRQ